MACCPFVQKCSFNQSLPVTAAVPSKKICMSFMSRRPVFWSHGPESLEQGCANPTPEPETVGQEHRMSEFHVPTFLAFGMLRALRPDLRKFNIILHPYRLLMLIFHHWQLFLTLPAGTFNTMLRVAQPHGGWSQGSSYSNYILTHGRPESPCMSKVFLTVADNMRLMQNSRAR